MPQPPIETVVQRMIDAGEPEENIAAVIQEYKKTSEPGMLSRAGSAAVDFVKNHPAQVGAVVGGLAAVPLTGGASLLPAMAAAGLGGAGGAGLGMIASAAHSAATGEPAHVPTTPGGVLGEMANEGASQAAGEMIGQGANAVLAKGAKRLYQAVLKPTTAARAENPALVETALKYAIPVSKGGAEKASGLVDASRTAADQLVADAAARPGAAMIDPRAAIAGITPAVSHAQNLQVGRPVMKAIGNHAREFLTEHPGALPLPKAQAMVRTEDQVLNDAYRAAIDRGDAVTAGSKAAEKGINDEMRSMLRKAVPGLQEQNAQTQAVEGVRQAVERRTGLLGNRSPIGMQHAINAGLAGVMGVGSGVRSGADQGASTGLGTFALLEALTHPATASRLAIAASHTPSFVAPAGAKTVLSPLVDELLKRLQAEDTVGQQ